MYTYPRKGERTIRSHHRALHGLFMDQGWALTLWGSIVMFFVAYNTIQPLYVIFYDGQIAPPLQFKGF